MGGLYDGRVFLLSFGFGSVLITRPSCFQLAITCIEMPIFCVCVCQFVAPDFIRAWVSVRGSIADFHHLTLISLELCFTFQLISFCYQHCPMLLHPNNRAGVASSLFSVQFNSASVRSIPN